MALQSKPHNSFLTRALAFLLLLSSVMVANHVHLEHGHQHVHAEHYAWQEPWHDHQDHPQGSDSSSEEIENCFVYHQLQSQDPESSIFVAIKRAKESHLDGLRIPEYTKTHSLLPPARGPPLA